MVFIGNTVGGFFKERDLKNWSFHIFFSIVHSFLKLESWNRFAVCVFFKYSNAIRIYFMEKQQKQGKQCLLTLASTVVFSVFLQKFSKNVISDLHIVLTRTLINHTFKATFTSRKNKDVLYDNSCTFSCEHGNSIFTKIRMVHEYRCIDNKLLKRQPLS